MNVDQLFHSDYALLFVDTGSQSIEEGIVK